MSMVRGMILGALLYHLAREAIDRHRETAQLFDDVSAVFTEEIRRLRGKPLEPLTFGEWLRRQETSEKVP